MQKSGTAFLYDCLNEPDGFNLPLLKEIHHFDTIDERPPRLRRLLRVVTRQLGQSKKSDKALLKFY